MDPVDVVAFGLWPLVAMGLWLGVQAKRRPPGRTRQIISLIMIVLLFGPALALMTYFNRHSAAVVAHGYTLLIALGLLFIAGLWWHPTSSWPKALLLIALGLGCTGTGTYNLIGDFVLRRDELVGILTGKRIEHSRIGTRVWTDYYINLGRVRLKATAQVYEAAEVGRRYRAQVGVASRRVLAIETLPF